MKKLRASILGIDSGDEILFEDFEDGGEMWTGRGQRERRRRIKFSERYLSTPTVHLSISLWDMDAGTVLRADVAAETVTEKGFDMVFRTWGDTRVARIRVAWMAVGELEDADTWDVG
ncbi:H-type lectin domain-containing protein [Sulfitobacter sp. HNIBRBA3233]|uniref:H-type lectin domain-containing protein n=1 Tax=Sulfitobacter marinivivus TaxID=3158558 RepID=UPI0032DEC4C0